MPDFFHDFVEHSLSYIKQYCDFIDPLQISNKIIADHICFKCETPAEYNYIRSKLEVDSVSEFFYQVFLSGRRVAYIKLRRGIMYKHGIIQFIEVAEKRPNYSERLGFHHIEIYPKNISSCALLATLNKLGIESVLKERPHHTTHDIITHNGFILRVTDVPLIQKIMSR